MAPHHEPSADRSLAPGETIDVVDADLVRRRTRLLLAVQFTTTVGLALIAPFRLPTRADWDQQWWIFLLFVAVVAAQTALRTRSGNPARRITSTGIEGSVIVALFWLSPWLAITGRVVGAVLGWLPTRLYPLRTQVYYAQSFASEMIVIASIFYLLQPDSSGAGPWHFAADARGWEPVATAFVIWACFVVGRIAACSGFDWMSGRPLAIRREWLHGPAALVSGAAVTFGLVGAISIDLSWIALLPVLALGFLLTQAGNSGRRTNTMQTAREQMVWFAERSYGNDVDEIERDLLQAIDAIRRFSTCAVARVGDDETVEWFGRSSSDVRDRLSGILDLERRDLLGFAADRRIDRSIAVWNIDVGHHGYLVIATRRKPQQLQQFAHAVGNLVSAASLGIDSARHMTMLLERAEQEHHLAHFDRVTDLPNRISAIAEVSGRMESPSPEAFGIVGVFIEDLDRVSDVLGSHAGDSVARAFASRLQRRSPHYAARIGPADFIAIVDGRPGVLEAMVEQLGAPGKARVGDETFTYHLRLGATSWEPGDEAQAEELLGRVDLAVRQSVNTGFPVFFGADEAGKEARKLAIRNRLPDALASHQLKPAFQPQIDLETGEVAGIEILARWTDSQLGVVYPDEFIGVAETSQQIEALTVSILEQSLQAAAEWRKFGVEVPMSLNLSAQSLRWPSFLEQLMNRLEAEGFSRDLLTAEITESTFAAGDETIQATDQLCSFGFRISIDDFGTGYSALSYLGAFPINEVKIDRSMVMKLGDMDSPSPIVRRLIDLCHDLGYSVVAEGIETIDQAETLLSLKCDIVQGYYFARPMMVEETTEWLRTFRPFQIRLPALLV